MDNLSVDVKWQKEMFKGVEIDTNQPPSVFKSQLFSLTGVPPDRQKIMVKGGLLKDDQDWAKAGLKSGQRLMMMGTADAVPTAPAAAQVFMEDLPEEQQDLTGLSKYGAGLSNLGNTCYMNSTLQCFYRVNELRDALARPGSTAESSGMANATSRSLATAAGRLFTDMQSSAQPVAPYLTWMQLRQAFPQFNQQLSTPKAQQGQGLAETTFAQQDAEECWSSLLTSLKSVVKGSSDGNASMVDELFGLQLHTRLKCEESDETIEEDTSSYALKCNINIDVNNLSEGIKVGLQDDREKHSEKLGRLAVFAGSSRVTRLPPYLTVQMVRFYYKANVQQKAKILRKVMFPMVFDAYEFASDELKARLDGPRSCAAAAEAAAEQAAKRQKREEQAKKDADAEAKAQAKKNPKASNAGTATHDGSTASAPAASSQADLAEAAKAETDAAAAATELRKAMAGQATGRYDLTAVLTHKGRSADSGHYVAWVKQQDSTWIQFDDEKMIVRKADEVLALSGGGDWHMAYLLLYKAQVIEA